MSGVSLKLGYTMKSHLSDLVTNKPFVHKENYERKLTWLNVYKPLFSQGSSRNVDIFLMEVITNDLRVFKRNNRYQLHVLMVNDLYIYIYMCVNRSVCDLILSHLNDTRNTSGGSNPIGIELFRNTEPAWNTEIYIMT